MSYSLRYLSEMKLLTLAMKVLNIRIWTGGLFSLLMLGVIGCTPVNYLGLAQPPVTPIRELLEDEKTEDEAIYLQGTVVDRAPFMDNGSYQLQDETGTVWVLTNGVLPQTGDQIMIKGQIQYQAIDLGGQDLGELYIVEVEQLDNQPKNPNQQGQPVSTSESKPESKPELDINELLLPHKSNSK
ncbi:MAG TPA: DNA-binding protein [Cyanothece sp. UBA12306]|nr:DNA-binding protein [Cyanothece sp. UBA12306]